jgi:hypothetical protein
MPTYHGGLRGSLAKGAALVVLLLVAEPESENFTPALHLCSCNMLKMFQFVGPCCSGVLPADSLACQRELPAWGPGIGQSHEYSSDDSSGHL